MIIENQGAEYGIVKWNDGPDVKLGDRLEIYPSNLDMSVNVYDRFYVARGEKIVDVWLTTPFEGGRHERRVKKIAMIERGEDPAKA